MVTTSDGGSSVQDYDLGELYQQLRELDRSDKRLKRQLCHVHKDRSFIQSGDSEHGTLAEGSLTHVSLESLNAQCQTLFSCQELNSGRRETLRNDINICSRPRLRPLTILDMPDEILVRVCECVKGWEPDVLRYGSTFVRSPSNIKNLRLTCWRFCNTSSHLLLPFVRVELKQASVEHLNTVSRHPTISKGVRAVRVVLDYYDYELANDFAHFAEYSAANLGDHADFLECMDSEEFEDRVGNNMETIRKTRQLENSCLSFASGAVDDATFGANPSHRKLLQRAHEEYRSRATDQKQVCESGAFVRIVTAAIGRMPRARRLELREHDGYSAPHWKRTTPPCAGDDDYFLCWMIRPMTWDEGRQWVLGTPHIDLLGLPGAGREAGTFLKSLEINITSLPESHDVLTAEEMRSLSMSVQQLKNIQIKLRGYRMANLTELGHALDTAELQYLRNYIDAVLNTHSIESLSLDLECFLDEDTGPLTDLGSLMTFRLWGNLEEVSWRSVSLYQKDMERFFQQLRKPLKFLHLCGVRLLDGSWAETLEILRTAPTGYEVTLSGPSGAECEDLSEEEINKIFRSQSGDYWGKSEAEDYITGYSRHNPLKPEENDHSDTSSTQ